MVINDIIQQAIAITQPRWKEQALAAGVNIEIRTELGSVPSVPGNDAELKEVLVNLLLNAAEAILEQGTITVRSEVQGPWLVLTVIDTGVGMNKEARQCCLEQKENESAGSGLGSIYGIVRKHGGQIDIQSEPGRGTAVAVRLPLDHGEKAPEAPKPAPSAVKPLRVLVVEDEPLVREVLTIYLAEDQHEVVIAENGREGLERFQRDHFDVVLTDRAMPDMNGDELAVEVKKLKPDQKLILLTGFGDLLSGTGELPPGVDLVVSKPFTLGGLRTAIATVLNQ